MASKKYNENGVTIEYWEKSFRVVAYGFHSPLLFINSPVTENLLPELQDFAQSLLKMGQKQKQLEMKHVLGIK